MAFLSLFFLFSRILIIVESRYTSECLSITNSHVTWSEVSCGEAPQERRKDKLPFLQFLFKVNIVNVHSTGKYVYFCWHIYTTCTVHIVCCGCIRFPYCRRLVSLCARACAHVFSELMQDCMSAEMRVFCAPFTHELSRGTVGSRVFIFFSLNRDLH